MVEAPQVRAPARVGGGLVLQRGAVDVVGPVPLDVPVQAQLVTVGVGEEVDVAEAAHVGDESRSRMPTAVSRSTACGLAARR